jgi:hypothetical protein
VAVNWTDEIAKVTDWDALVRVSHNMALEKGWWSDGVASRPIEEIIANFHSEVSEAWEEYRAGRMATWYSGDAAESLRSGKIPKPEGFCVELADLVIRIADAVGAHRIDVDCEFAASSQHNLSEFVCWLHDLIANENFHWAIEECFYFADCNQHDLWATIREKLAYNATRPYRHGGKKA